jgi:hypothetical protein
VIIHLAYLIIGGVVVAYAGTLLVDFAAGIAEKASSRGASRKSA